MISQTGDFSTSFQNNDHRHPILTIIRVKGFKLHHDAKFCGDWSNCCWDMAIFQFFEITATAVLDFTIFEI